MAEAEITTVARPYARAAFAFARDEDGGVASWSKHLRTLAAVVDDPAVRLALDNPVLTAEGQAALLLDLCGEEISGPIRSFVGLLAEYDRIAALPSVSELFEAFKSAFEKTVEVSVISAFPVEDADAERLKKALTDKLSREVNIVTAVDQSLLGGVIIRTEDTVIDDSVRGKLEKLAQAL